MSHTRVVEAQAQLAESARVTSMTPFYDCGIARPRASKVSAGHCGYAK
eukprot:CAMPEP_0172796184 /NCGR_PEP_ID=MMETSP1074-20121228/210857_1 /TAXON_ID=2916 /ORGANISM="Ceratium fusus, Strain PA161109" /LENGTH=47 /DNA_ID= /DNA_START= /DNA_END= /DNA_ORIENTATION=